MCQFQDKSVLYSVSYFSFLSRYCKKHLLMAHYVQFIFRSGVSAKTYFEKSAIFDRLFSIIASGKAGLATYFKISGD